MRKDDLGAAVTALQRQLTAAGFTTDLTGVYDDATEASVAAFQQRTGLIADGIAGRKTLAALGGDRDPHLLSEADLVKAAARLGVPLAAVKAVNSVESRGHGFLDDGRPVILFERHVLYKLWKEAGNDDADALAKRYPAVINPKRGGYVGGTAEWHRLSTARQIAANISGFAFESCSWGQFQIMGYHWKTLGYASISAFVTAMETSEAAQLDAFVRFIESEPALHKALKAGKWPEFARLYNGPAYKDNLYDVKLARAFARFSTEGAA